MPSPKGFRSTPPLTTPRVCGTSDAIAQKLVGLATNGSAGLAEQGGCRPDHPIDATENRAGPKESRKLPPWRARHGAIE